LLLAGIEACQIVGFDLNQFGSGDRCSLKGKLGERPLLAQAV
jgi:hypothetical protein